MFRHLHFTGPFTVRLPNGRDLTLHSWGNRVENELAWRGWDGHEPDERRRWAAMVALGGDVLDIGANTATFAVTAKALAPQARVFAFEPIERIAARAARNVEVSGLDVEMVRAAVGREAGELPIFDPGGENAYSASLDPDFLPGTKDSYTVPVVSVDGFVQERGLDPGAIKLDVEGYEGEAIAGATRTLERGRCVILCEWLGSSEANRDAARLLAERDYVALDVVTLEPEDLTEGKGYGERNVLLAHRARAETIRAEWPRFERA